MTGSSNCTGVVFFPATVPNEGYAILAGFGIGIFFVGLYFYCTLRVRRAAARAERHQQPREESPTSQAEIQDAGVRHTPPSRFDNDMDVQGGTVEASPPPGPPPAGAGLVRPMAPEDPVTSTEATRRRLMREAPAIPPR